MLDEPAAQVYFETPERNERLQLLVHLIHNAEELLYLRAPHGGGKTRFASHLVELVKDEFCVAWLNARALGDVVADLCSELGLDERAPVDWPASVIDGCGERRLLLIVDDADQLDLTRLGRLVELHELGACLLLVGEGGLAHLHAAWDLRFIDLPPFDAPQALLFLRAQGFASPILPPIEQIPDLCRACSGLPGPLLEAMHRPNLSRSPAPQRQVSGVAIAVAALLLAGVVVLLIYQDAIRALFPVAPYSTQPVSLPPVVATQGAAQTASPTTAVLPPPAVAGSAATETPSIAPALPPPMVVVVSQVDPLDAVMRDALAAEQPAQAYPDEDRLLAGLGGNLAPPRGRPEPDNAPLPVPVPVPVPALPKAVAPVAPPPVIAPIPHDMAAQSAWLQAQTPTRYTLQLVGAHDLESIDAFIRHHGIRPPYAIFERELNGAPWYSLVAGSYRDRAAAVAARRRLDKTLRTQDIWPRTFASIQELLAKH